MLYVMYVCIEIITVGVDIETIPHSIVKGCHSFIDIYKCTVASKEHSTKITTCYYNILDEHCKTWIMTPIPSYFEQKQK